MREAWEKANVKVVMAGGGKGVGNIEIEDQNVRLQPKDQNPFAQQMALPL